jgi:formylmethanofuran dehydrogenase subunit D
MSPSKSQIPLTIVTYRDAFQWMIKEKEGVSTGYQEHSAILRLSPQDMEALGIGDNARVKLSNALGTVVVQAKADDKCQQGFGYMPVSPYINRLTSYDPAKAKLPDFKRIEVMVEATEADITPISELEPFEAP